MVTCGGHIHACTIQQMLGESSIVQINMRILQISESYKTAVWAYNNIM